MPWDTSLNKDLHDAIKYHVAATADFYDDDHRKFDMSTPKRGVAAYKRALTLYPLQHRVVQDVTKVFQSMLAVHHARGIKIDGLGNRPGKWFLRSSKPRGGYHPRLQAEDDYGAKVVHDDANSRTSQMC
jgi:hypothetical protein